MEKEEKLKFEVSPDEENKRLDLVSSSAFKLTRTKAKTLIDEGKIKVNDKVFQASYKLKSGEVLEYFPTDEEEFSIKPENIPLDIYYEDKDLIVLNKQKGLICHPTNKNEKETLVSALLYHTKNLSDIGGKERLGIVHRLDKDTSGLMLVAKNNPSHLFLQKDIKEKRTKRKYLAICHGIIEENEGIIDTPILHSLKNTVKMVTSKEGLSALTRYKVLERLNSATFLEIQLETGRTHQIRCHFSSINHPLIGDDTYGAKGFKNNFLKQFKPKGQVLMSYYLSFTHPSSGEIMEFEIKKENYHPDLVKALELLRS